MGSVCEGSSHFGSGLAAPAFWKLPYEQVLCLFFHASVSATVSSWYIRIWAYIYIVHTCRVLIMRLNLSAQLRHLRLVPHFRSSAMIVAGCKTTFIQGRTLPQILKQSCMKEYSSRRRAPDHNLPLSTTAILFCRFLLSSLYILYRKYGEPLKTWFWQVKVW